MKPWQAAAKAPATPTTSTLPRRHCCLIAACLHCWLAAELKQRTYCLSSGGRQRPRQQQQRRRLELELVECGGGRWRCRGRSRSAFNCALPLQGVYAVPCRASVPGLAPACSLTSEPQLGAVACTGAASDGGNNRNGGGSSSASSAAAAAAGGGSGGSGAAGAAGALCWSTPSIAVFRQYLAVLLMAGSFCCCLLCLTQLLVAVL